MYLIPQHLQRLPQVKEHNWLVHAILLEFLEASASRYSQGVLVDIGCGNKPYEFVFAPFVTRHIGVDLQGGEDGKSRADIIGSAYTTSLPDSSCDVVLCTEVLEHLELPQMAIQEMFRILKPDGYVILTVPFFWQIHEAPRDFYRYSEYGLRFLFEASGFETVEVRPLTGYSVTSTQLSIYYWRKFQRGGVLRFLGRIANWLLQHVALRLNRYDKSHEFTNLYGFIARRK